MRFDLVVLNLVTEANSESFLLSYLLLGILSSFSYYSSRKFSCFRTHCLSCSLGLLPLELGLLVFRIFYWVLLGLDLNYSEVNWTGFLLTPMIYLPVIEGRLKDHFGHNFNCFLIISSKISNSCTFCCLLVLIEGLRSSLQNLIRSVFLKTPSASNFNKMN